MSTVPPKPIPVVARSGRPSTRNLLGWGALVLALHLAVLLSLAGTLDWQLSAPQTLRTGPVQTRHIAASAAAPTVQVLPAAPAARTRIAMVEKPKPKPKPIPPPKPATPKTAALFQPPQTTATAEGSPTAEPNTPSDLDEPQTANLTNSEPLQQSGQVSLDNLMDRPPTKDLAATTESQSDPVTAKAPEADIAAPVTTTPEGLAPADPPNPTPTTAPTNGQAEAAKTRENQRIETRDTPTMPAPEGVASTTLALPEIALTSLPPSALLSYRLNGQDKGVPYQASGQLRWQHNASVYSMSLSVRAFLLGSRHWRSVGQINNTGLAPTRFSDSWRSERAAHFDRPNQRIVFSNNAPAAPLQPGAQDQVSLYVQLAAAMAQPGQPMPPGTRLQIQTATVRDALPWLLTLENQEILEVDGQSLQTVKWVCQPRNRFDAQVEFWVSAAHDWLPARIRITQASGSYIDLQLIGREALDALPLNP